ncbi:MAG TPA: sigma-70 family RNA polymerase sigma factor [Candidatus Acidoferrales bacterium]|nr:sigma-70 family RNA polymerase sigma factor [Candidatus Acidoferrales bacterium]
MLPETAPDFGDEELVLRAQDGDREAFAMLVERYKRKAYRIAFDFTRDREEAKDLSQEAFLRAFSHLKSFDLRSTFYTWFYRILVNLCLDHKRRHGKLLWTSLEDTRDGNARRELLDRSSTPDEEASAEQTAAAIESALAALPPKQRTAFFLRNHEGLSIKEIAKVMRTAEGTVKVHLHRAVVQLRRELAGAISARTHEKR